MSPTSTAPLPLPTAQPVEDAPLPEEVSAPSWTSRVASRKTVVSLGITVVVLAVAIWRAPTLIDWQAVGSDVRRADLKFYGLAIVVYYLSFVVRALRWKLLLRNTGEEISALPLGEILLASFFVNCVVPAKMGDLYRAVQLRSRHGVGGAKSLGTIVAERLLDLFVLMGLLLLAGVVTFRDHVPTSLVPALVAFAALCVLAAAALVVMIMGRGRRVLRLLPEQLVIRYENFRSGTVDAFGRWPLVLPLSVAVWALEGLRLGFVIISLGYFSQVGPAHFLLVALIAALLTTVPFLPGGLALVEGGMIAVLGTFNLSTSGATAVALLDRSISFASLILVGGVVFLVFHARHAGRPATVVAADG